MYCTVLSCKQARGPLAVSTRSWDDEEIPAGRGHLSPSKHWDTEESNSIQPAERLPFRCLAWLRIVFPLCVSDAARSSVVAVVVPVVAVMVGGANTPIEQKERGGNCMHFGVV
ncbi:hypothetical protein H0G86_004020 [Trichoderma simmonsii]|uniref:Uncharacterized protein n=1 Tax=Trichoderma simmonsii TaxID=1491479 RepID=A0A8G0PD20_9HYPO|nr:hypothetical protein H0G86_004020 [Trichoderma simmonsii]